MNKIDVCPQQILSFDAPNDITNDALNNVLNEEWQHNNNPNNYYTKDTFLHKRDEYKYLIKWFDQCLYNVQKEKRYMFHGEFSIVQCWANKTTINGYHHPHNHPNSMLSGIFYLTDSTPTIFSESLRWNLPLIPSMNNDATITRVTPVKGRLLVFPSTLLHGTDRSNDNEPRYSMSFNTFIQGELGDAPSLDYVSINK